MLRANNIRKPILSLLILAKDMHAEGQSSRPEVAIGALNVAHLNKLRYLKQ